MRHVLNTLRSHQARLVSGLLLGLIALALAREVALSIGVVWTGEFPVSKKIWFALVLIIASDTAGILCIWLMMRKSYWAVWVWAVTTLSFVSIGILLGLSIGFLARWDVIAPWVVLVLSAAISPQFARPSRRDSLARVAAPVLAVLLCVGVGSYLIYPKKEPDGYFAVPQLVNLVREWNQDLPRMVNEELRIDQISVATDGMSFLMRFPHDSLTDLKADPGLDVIREHYTEYFASLACEIPDFPDYRPCLVDGQACIKLYFQTVDANSEEIFAFSVDGAECP